MQDYFFGLSKQGPEYFYFWTTIVGKGRYICHRNRSSIQVKPWVAGTFQNKTWITFKNISAEAGQVTGHMTSHLMSSKLPAILKDYAKKIFLMPTNLVYFIVAFQRKHWHLKEMRVMEIKI